MQNIEVNEGEIKIKKLKKEMIGIWERFMKEI